MQPKKKSRLKAALNSKLMGVISKPSLQRATYLCEALPHSFSVIGRKPRRA
jgi:hypothetical protein